MRKAELVKMLKERIEGKYPFRVNKKTIAAIVDEFFSIIKDELSKGQEVKLGGLGTFKIREVQKEEGTRKFIRFVPAKR